MLKNQEIESLTLIEDLGVLYTSKSSKEKRRFCIYQCRCGNKFKAQERDIKRRHTSSCGCHRKQKIKEANTTHGLRSHRLYKIWNGMIQRVSNPKSTKYQNYGGRGIKVCNRWLDVKNFIEDMYPSFKEGLTIDRINNDGNYEPSNCRWTTNEIQHRNTRVLMSTNTSGYRGVCFDKTNNKWMASISVNKKNIYLGRFSVAMDAAKAYDSYVIENNLDHKINGVNL